jgi:hypothetical protein
VHPVPSTVIASAWAVVPFAAVAIACSLWHLHRLQLRIEMNPVRRRVRMANAVVMVLLAGLLAYGLSGVTTATPRKFVAAWAGILSLALVMGALATFDAFHTGLASYFASRKLRRGLRRGPPDRLS